MEQGLRIEQDRVSRVNSPFFAFLVYFGFVDWDQILFWDLWRMFNKVSPCISCLDLTSKHSFLPPPSVLSGSGFAALGHRTLHHTPSSRTAALTRIRADSDEDLRWVGRLIFEMVTNLFGPAPLLTSLQEAYRHLPHRTSASPEQSWQTQHSGLCNMLTP